MSPDTETNDQLLHDIATQEVKGLPGKRWIIIAGVVVLLLAITAIFVRRSAEKNAPQYVTADAARGILVVNVSATGNLQPVDQVDVGSEESGLVESVFADDNDRVTKGQVLVRLDTTLLSNDVVNAEGGLASSEARVQQAAASRNEAHATLNRLREVSRLSGGKVPAPTELDGAQATYDRSVAEESSSRAAVEQARASLRSALTRLSKAVIRSPIDGVVLARSIEPGQTVAASFEAPVLFTLARDLAEMELRVDIDEADVGSVEPEQPATFSVDAYPGRRYPATIQRVDLGSKTKDGVVSYTGVLVVRNTDLSLRPGMTATAQITTLQRVNVLLVPNAALRFEPATTTVEATDSGSFVSKLMPRPPTSGAKKSSGEANTSNSAQHVWVLTNGEPVEVPVTTGATDGRNTEITAGSLSPGAKVIVETSGEAS